MKTIRPFLSAALLLAVLVFSSAAKKEKWQSLFNGRDLAGWAVVNDAEFNVKDGNLHLVKGMGWLRTEKEYGDFILEMECRALVENYDSGIYFRSGLEGVPWPKGGWQVNLVGEKLGILVKGRGLMQPESAPKAAVNEWFKLRLEAQGARAALQINGKNIWTNNLVETPKGYIGIQAENKEFEFRNIRLQELQAGAKPDKK